jgi:hypothetical protein
MTEVPFLPSLVAVIVADPAAIAVTRPLPLTVATVGWLLDHVTTRPVSVLPAESFATAESCCVEPIETVALAGVTDREATGMFVKVTVAVVLKPFPVAVTAYSPGVAPAVYTPADEMLPPVAPQATVTGTESPPLSLP